MLIYGILKIIILFVVDMFLRVKVDGGLLVFQFIIDPLQ